MMDYFALAVGDARRRGSLCLVTDADYRLHWQAEPPPPVSLPPPLARGERRANHSDRRMHNRRDDRSIGRRYRLTDRRK